MKKLWCQEFNWNRIRDHMKDVLIIYIYFTLFERHTHTHSERSSSCWFKCRMPMTARAGASQRQVRYSLQVSCMVGMDPSTWGTNDYPQPMIWSRRNLESTVQVCLKAGVPSRSYCCAKGPLPLHDWALHIYSFSNPVLQWQESWEGWEHAQSHIWITGTAKVDSQAVGSDTTHVPSQHNRQYLIALLFFFSLMYY